MQPLARIKTLDTLLCFGQYGFRSHQFCLVKPSSLSPTSLQAQMKVKGVEVNIMRMQAQPTCSLHAVMSMVGLVQHDEETVVLMMGGEHHY